VPFHLLHPQGDAAKHAFALAKQHAKGWQIGLNFEGGGYMGWHTAFPKTSNEGCALSWGRRLRGFEAIVANFGGFLCASNFDARPLLLERNSIN
jgi:hypothetical protein